MQIFITVFTSFGTVDVGCAATEGRMLSKTGESHNVVGWCCQPPGQSESWNGVR